MKTHRREIGYIMSGDEHVQMKYEKITNIGTLGMFLRTTVVSLLTSCVVLLHADDERVLPSVHSELYNCV